MSANGWTGDKPLSVMSAMGDAAAVHILQRGDDTLGVAREANGDDQILRLHQRGLVDVITDGAAAEIVDL